MRPALVVRRAADYLSRHDVESPFASAEILLANVLGTDRAGLYARDEGLSAAEAKRFGRALCRRCAGVPLQHLTGEEGFRHLVLLVRPGVFIPRPETEILVEHALATLRDLPAPVVVDVGTGTGAIALAIKDEAPTARVLAIDVSPDAVALARENAARSNLDVDVMAGDLLDALPEALHGAVDLVVSNPPYVEEDELPGLSREARADPVLALAGGVETYVRLFAQAFDVLRPGGAIAVEIGETHGRSVGAAASDAGLVTIVVEQDLTGRDRFVTARKPV